MRFLEVETDTGPFLINPVEIRSVLSDEPPTRTIMFGLRMVRASNLLDDLEDKLRGFIRLHKAHGGSAMLVNPSKITHIHRDGSADGTSIHTDGGAYYFVKETPDEILKQTW